MHDGIRRGTAFSVFICCVFSLVKSLLRSLVHFKIRSWVFLLFKEFLCLFWMTILLTDIFCQTFSPSLWLVFFIFLMVSFAEQIHTLFLFCGLFLLSVYFFSFNFQLLLEVYTNTYIIYRTSFLYLIVIFSQHSFLFYRYNLQPILLISFWCKVWFYCLPYLFSFRFFPSYVFVQHFLPFSKVFLNYQQTLYCLLLFQACETDISALYTQQNLSQ